MSKSLNLDFKLETYLFSCYQDSRNYPLGSEKILFSLIYYLGMKSLSSDALQKTEFPNKEKADEVILESIKLLQGRMNTEDLLDTSIIAEIATLERDISSKSYLNAYDLAKKLLRTIQPVNIQELIRLVGKAEEAAKTAKGKTLYVLFGDTGAGKSTTIQYLSGATMNMIKRGNLDHIEADPESITNPALKNVTTSPDARSETRYITVIDLALKALGVKKIDAPEILSLCDTPGFGDTAGAEVDISNSKGLIDAIKNTDAVVPILLISEKSIGNRMVELRRLVHIIIGMIKNFSTYKNQIQVFFTNWDAESLSFLNAKLNNLSTCIEDSAMKDKAFISFIERLEEITAEKDTIIHIDPLDSRPANVLKKMLEFEPIKNTAKVFQTSFSQTSMSKLQEQASRHKLSIRHAIKRFDIPFIKHKLDELVTIQKIIGSENDNDYKESLKFLAQTCNLMFEDTSNNIKRCYSKLNQLTKEDLQKFSDLAYKAELIDSLKGVHLEENVPGAKSYLEQIALGVKANFENVVNLFLDIRAAGLIEKQPDIAIKDIPVKPAKVILEERVLDLFGDVVLESLDKIYNTSICFKEHSETYEKTKSFLQIVINSIFSNFDDFVVKYEFVEISKSISTLENASSLLSTHLENIFSKEFISTLKQKVIKKLEDLIVETAKILEIKKLENSHFLAIEKFLAIIEDSKSKLHSVLSEKDLNELSTKFFGVLSMRFEFIDKECQEMFKGENVDFKKIEEYYEEMNMLRKNQKISEKTTEYYFKVLEGVCSLFSRISEKIDNLISNLATSDFNASTDKIFITIKSIKNAEWLEKFRPGIYNDVLDSIEAKIKSKIYQRKESLDVLFVDIMDPKNLKEIRKLLKEVSNLKYFEPISPNVGSFIAEVQNEFSHTLKSLVQVIESFCDKDLKDEKNFDFDLEKAINYQTFMNDLVQSGIEPTLIRNLLEKFYQALNSFGVMFNNTLDENISLLGAWMKKGEGKDITNVVKKTFNMLKRLKVINDSDKNFLANFGSYGSKILEIESICLNMEAKLNECFKKAQSEEQNPIIEQLLTIASFLIRLDIFLDEKKNFSKIYNVYNQKYELSITSDMQEFNKCLDDNDFITAVDLVQKLKNTTSETSISQLRNMVKIIKKKSNLIRRENQDLDVKVTIHLEEDQSKSLRENMNLIYDFITKFSGLIKNGLDDSGEEYKKALKAIDAEVQSLELTFSDTLESISSKAIFAAIKIAKFVENCNFQEAQRRKSILDIYMRIFENILQPEVKKEIDSYLQDEKIIKIVKDYETLPIEYYFQHPPKNLYERLKSFDFEIRFSEALEIFKQILKDKILELMKEAEKQYINSENQALKKLDYSLQFMPDDIVQQFDNEIKDKKKQLRAKNTQFRELINTLLDDNNLSELGKVYDHAPLEIEKSYIEHKINARIYDLQSNFASMLVQNNYKSSLEILDILCNYSKITFIKNLQTRLEDLLLIWNDYINKKIESISTLTQTKIISPERALRRVFYFEVLEFYYVTYSFKNQELKPKEDAKKLHADLLKLAKTHFSEIADSFKTNLQDLNFVEIFNTLEMFDNAKALIEYLFKNDIGHKDINLVSLEEQLVLFIGKIVTNFENIKLLTVSDMKYYDEFYKKINDDLNGLKNFRKLNKFYPNSDALYDKCVNIIKSKISDEVSFAQKDLGEISQNIKSKSLEQDTIENFNSHLKNIVSSTKNLSIGLDYTSKIESFDRKVKECINVAFSELNSATVNLSISEFLIIMMLLAENFYSEKEAIFRLMETYFYKTEFQEKIEDIKLLLEQDQRGIGNRIVANFRIFDDQTIFNYNTLASKVDPSDFLSKMIGRTIQNDKGKIIINEQKIEFEDLEKIFIKHLAPKSYTDAKNKNSSTYGDLVSKNLSSKALINYTEINSSMKSLIKKIDQIVKKDNKINYGNTEIKLVPQLAAHVLAIYTLLNSDQYFKTSEKDPNRSKYLFTPNIAQIYGILRLLGVDLEGDENSEGLDNHLLRMKPGEGKNLVLAVCASVLALIGFEVYVACYSDDLASNEFEKYKALFMTIGVQDRLRYSSLKKICEESVSDPDDLPKMFKEYVSNNRNMIAQSKEAQRSHKVLLIDEIDAVFKKSFYGKSYTPMFTLEHENITNLINKIWENKDATLDQISQTFEYRFVLNLFPRWKELVDEGIKRMLKDLQNSLTHSHYAINDQIVYERAFKTYKAKNYGYQTLCAALNQNKYFKISKSSLNKYKKLYFHSLEFSYAEILKSKFSRILCASSLYLDTDDHRNLFTQTFNIKYFTYMLSAFNSSSSLKIDKLEIENPSDHIDKISLRIRNILSGAKRAIVVVFKSDEEILDFEAKKLKGTFHQNILSNCTYDELNSLAKKATKPGCITLINKRKIRGLELTVNSRILEEAGGLHIIQAYQAESLFEEYQIKTRVARLGRPGSYGKIIKVHDLDAIFGNIKLVDDFVTNRGPLYEEQQKLNLDTNLYVEHKLLQTSLRELKIRSEHLKALENAHKESEGLLKLFKDENFEKIKHFLIRKNATSQDPSPNNIIIALDGCSSNSGLVECLRINIHRVLDRVQESLKDAELDLDNIAIKLMVYRNYNSTEKDALQISSWESDPNGLRAFCEDALVAKSGLGGNQAVEAALNAVGNEVKLLKKDQKIKGVILVGDQPANNAQQLAAHKQAYKLDDNRFKSVKVAYEEAAILQGLGIKVNTISLGNAPEADFKAISEATGGIKVVIDIAKENRFNKIVDYICHFILQSCSE